MEGNRIGEGKEPPGNELDTGHTVPHTGTGLVVTRVREYYWSNIVV